MVEGSLIIIAGVSGVGKSTLIRRLCQGELPSLCAQLGMDSPCLYSCWAGRQLLKQPEILDAQVILHYDFLHIASLQTDIKYLPDVVHNRTSITVLTLCASADELQHRIQLRFYRALQQFSFRPDKFRGKRIIRLYKTRNLYKDTHRSLSLYRTWSEGLRQGVSVDNHLILDCSDTRIGLAEAYDLRTVAKILERPCAPGNKRFGFRKHK